MMAGMVAFFTIVYIVIVNAAILSDAGIPLVAGIIATVFVSFLGSMIMGFWANAPILLVPGMGINAMFVYTFVHSMGLMWQEALAVVVLSGVIFCIIAFTKLAPVITESIPSSLKEAIAVGIGIFLTFIGLQQGGLVIADDSTFVTLGNISDAHVIVTIVTLLVAVTLFIRQVPGNFLISILFGTALAYFLGVIGTGQTASMSLAPYGEVFFGFSFSSWLTVAFMAATFSLVMVIVFENIGLIHGHLNMVGSPEKYKRTLQANAVSVLSCGFLGTSPTVATVESAAGIAAGGRTGLTTITTGFMFLASLFFIPFITMIPPSAIAPVLIIIGGLMMQNIQKINLNDFSEGFPAFLVIVLIPLTYSIADGIAFGFVAYPLLKILLGKHKELSAPLVIISALFFLNFVLQVWNGG
ncbi:MULTISPECIES: NCS2 family permease [Alteribacter]|uniref:NCS2 family permease n=1 Tax=Alteribacter keqinensis TaxID=2483800 RepID=A0A3M7TY71_9BACI|nr:MULTISPECIES: NCS2 family permease [Alteribacter]MBM7097524.1 NCS2 family permease [Alteribacter salitolerans]RNA70526.1 NCS2 family permease [Alteribacter keqinensis]